MNPRELSENASLPHTISAQLQDALHKHVQLSTILRTEIYRLKANGDKLCVKKNDPLFSLYTAGLLDEMQDALHAQLEKQAQIATMLSFPVACIDSLSVPRMSRKITRNLFTDITLAQGLMSRLVDIGASCNCQEHNKSRHVLRQVLKENATQQHL